MYPSRIDRTQERSPDVRDADPGSTAAVRDEEAAAGPRGERPWWMGTWRVWLVDRDAHGVPRLTGLYGTSWDGPRLEARCIRRTVRIDHGPIARSSTTRAHRHIPDRSCSCGVHVLDPTGDDRLAARIVRRLVPAGRVHVIGGVAVEGTAYPAERLFGVRARRAAAVRIVGPLVVVGARLAPWHPAHRRSPQTEALEALAASLGIRYRVPAYALRGNRSIGS